MEVISLPFGSGRNEPTASLFSLQHPDKPNVNSSSFGLKFYQSKRFLQSSESQGLLFLKATKLQVAAVYRVGRQGNFDFVENKEKAFKENCDQVIGGFSFESEREVNEAVFNAEDQEITTGGNEGSWNADALCNQWNTFWDGENSSGKYEKASSQDPSYNMEQINLLVKVIVSVANKAMSGGISAMLGVLSPPIPEKIVVTAVKGLFVLSCLWLFKTALECAFQVGKFMLLLLLGLNALRIAATLRSRSSDQWPQWQNKN